MSNINVFDFDGVLCDPLEDTIFRLPENDLDEKFIRLGRDRYGITYLSDNVARNRHLLLQEVLYERKHCPEPGPLLPTLMQSTDPFYVLTARSGPGAVARVSQFFEAIGKRPEEMFFVGPMSKDHCLIDLCHKFEDKTLTFYDDNMHHIEAAAALGLPNLQLAFIDNSVAEIMPIALEQYKQIVDWLAHVQEP